MDFIQKYAEISLARASHIKQIKHLWKGDLMELAVRLGETASVSALRDIRRVLDDEKLDDSACFRKIEEIVNRYERLGPGAGSRHDFSLPFQIGVAGSRFAKPFVKISKSGSRLLMVTARQTGIYESFSSYGLFHEPISIKLPSGSAM